MSSSPLSKRRSIGQQKGGSITCGRAIAGSRVSTGLRKAPTSTTTARCPNDRNGLKDDLGDRHGRAHVSCTEVRSTSPSRPCGGQAEAEGCGDLWPPDPRLPRQVGYRAGHAEDAVVAAGGEAEAVGGAKEELAALGVGGGDFVEQRALGV